MTKNFRYLVFFITSLAVFLMGILKPYNNWDMIGYIAAAYYQDGIYGEDLRSQVYSDIKSEIKEKDYKTLIDGDYRNSVYRDYLSLEQHIPFYIIRVGYIKIMRILKKFDISYVKSTIYISAIFSALCLVFISFFLEKMNISHINMPVIVWVSGYITISRLATPDAITCFLSLLTIYLYFYSRSWLFLFCIILLPFFRTDFIILSCLIAVFAYLKDRSFKIVVSVFLALSVYLFINKIYQNYGWLTIFNFTLIDINPYPKDMVIASNLNVYISAYLKGFKELLFHPHSIIYLLSGLIFTFGRGFLQKNNMQDDLVKICFLFVFFHMIAFPAYMSRFFVFPVTLLSLVIISFLLDRINSRS